MPLLQCPSENLVNRDAGNKGPAIRDYNRDTGNHDKGPAVSWLAALMNCIPGFITAQFKGVAAEAADSC